MNDLTWQDNADELLVIADKAYSKLCHRLGLTNDNHYNLFDEEVIDYDV